jgi:flagellin
MSSGITLSAATRQNLLVAQSTADLLATTQTRLATGKKVNSALDNPTSFFTAQNQTSRANDLTNLLDSISNGVQVIQQANAGITSIQKLLDSAKSVANQALQAASGYTTKSSVSTTVAGATAQDLRGTATFSNAQAPSNVLFSGAANGTTAITGATTLSGVAGVMNSSAAVTDAASAAITGATTLYGAAGLWADAATSKINDGDVITVNGKSVTFKAAALPQASTMTGTQSQVGNVVTDGSGNSTVYLGTDATTSTATMADLLSAIDIASGARSITGVTGGTATLSAAASTIAAGPTPPAGTIRLSSSTGSDLNLSGEADILNKLKLSGATGSGAATVSVLRTTSTATLGTLVTDGSTLSVNGKTITFKDNAPPPTTLARGGVVSGTRVETDGSGNSTVYLKGATMSDVLTAMDLASGVQTATVASGTATLTTAAGATNSSLGATGALKISTGTLSDLTITGTGNAMSALGLAGTSGTTQSFTASRASVPGGMAGKTLTFGSMRGGTAVNVTFGDGTNGTVKTLDQLNTVLGANNLNATLDSSGKLTISTTNDNASATIGGTLDGGTMGGTSATLFSAAAAPVADVNAQNARAQLIKQYNQILDNIKTTAQDAGYNGTNLLNGDNMKLTFNERGTSAIQVQGVIFDATGLGLAKLGQNGLNEFQDNTATNKVLDFLNTAAGTLRNQASTFGSNLSVVQNRQEFNKNVINNLETGAAKLTDADLNEEAANSQALSTRQSLTVSALSLANQAQQSILQLLR